MGSYREHALEGASAVDLVVALYDGIIRFLNVAITAVERRSEDERRLAVKRALDIIIHLQARLRMDVGGRPAEVLSEFYASVFAEILQASQSSSRLKFEHAIECVKTVREAWREVAKDPEANRGSSRGSMSSSRGAGNDQNSGQDSGQGAEEEMAVSSWTA
jgi:flagellar secretion chaperone FliS